MDQGELVIRERQLRELHKALSNHPRLRSGLRVLTVSQVLEWLKEETVELHLHPSVEAPPIASWPLNR
jgi:hypothetical protein